MNEFLILFLAAVIQAYAGFGYAIFSIPLLMLLAGRDYQTAVVVCNVTFLLQSGIMTASVVRQIRVVDVMTVGLLVPVGAWLANATVFAEMKHPWVKAVFVCVFGSYLIYIAQRFLNHWPTRETGASRTADSTDNASLSVSTDCDDGQTPSSENQSFPVRLMTWWMSLLTGLITGIVGAVSGTTGPPLIAYSRRRHWDEKQLRVFLQPIFCWAALWSCVGYWLHGPDTAPFTALTSVVAFPSLPAFASAVVLGTIMGLQLQAISNRGRESRRKTFQWYFYQIIRLLGFMMIVQLVLSLLGTAT
ncbi:MAG: TSUP family transporter [Planctomycetota bacterium]